MLQMAVRVRDLVTSNIDTLVGKATNPAKVLGLLRSEIEESLVGLHGDLTKATREHARAAAHAGQLAETAEEWTGKAKTAVDHGREDLARSALLARESGLKDAAAATLDAEELGSKVSELESAIAELESKRDDVIARIADEAVPAPTPANENASADTKTARRMDRIDAMERRAALRSDGEDATSPADIEAEIAGLARDSKIDAELAAMKAPAKKRAPRKKAK